VDIISSHNYEHSLLKPFHVTAGSAELTLFRFAMSQVPSVLVKGTAVNIGV
jgi:hypothetical protein